NRLSFFSLQFSVPVSWAAASSDFYVYYPPSTRGYKSFLMIFTGLFTAFVFVNMIGVGLASGVASDPLWQEAYDTSSSALILAGYSGLNGFGKFCGVIVALGVIDNNCPGTYASTLGCQVLGRYPKMAPRWLWVCVIRAHLLCLRCRGPRDHLFLIFQNTLWRSWGIGSWFS
ncbi:MAG: hypothetical protein Q9183_006935, partial [Haloplaca sp. 2 TL-2023]